MNVTSSAIECVGDIFLSYSPSHFFNVSYERIISLALEVRSLNLILSSIKVLILTLERNYAITCTADTS